MRGSRPALCIATVAGLAAVVSIVPVQAFVTTSSSSSSSYLQSFAVLGSASIAAIVRDDYSATPGIQALAASGTNRDWARMVLMFAGFPQTDGNITVMLRWMRQENGPDDWWNRNNPLNNGWGSGGGSGLGSYPNLVVAAENAAEALHSLSGYSGIVAGFSRSAPTAEIESAIWASPWAASHYANGSHWAYSSVPVVSAPRGAWGL